MERTTADRRHDDLFEPSLTGRARPRPPEGERPWRLGSQFYVAFFGGVLAVAAIAWVNAGRLGLEPARRRLIPLVALGGLVGVVATVELSGGGEIESSQRILARVIAVATFGVLYAIQNSADRVYHTFLPGDEDEMYDSLWGPGLAATFGLGLVQLGIVAGAVTLL